MNQAWIVASIGNVDELMRSNLLALLRFQHQSKIMLILVSVAMVTIVLDTSYNKIIRFDIYERLSSEKIVLFTAIIIISVIVQYFLLQFAKLQNISFTMKSRLHLNILDRALPLVQLALFAIMIFVILEILLTSSYRIDALIVSTVVSYAVAMAIMTLLTFRFFSWYRSNRNLVVLLYGVSSIAISFNIILGILAVGIALQAQPDVMMDRATFPAPFVTSGPFESFVNYSYVGSSIISFILTWAATAFLLRHHFRTTNRLAYWFTMSLPLGFFLFQFHFFLASSLSFFSSEMQPQSLYLTIFSELIRADPNLFGLISTMVLGWSKPIGGIIFGIAFFIVARKTSHNDIIKKYAMISAFGYMLLFVSNQAGVLISATYPPFGILAVSSMGLSSYLILVGIYSSAISLSEDANIRRMIRTSILRESNLLDILGIPEREKSLAQKIRIMAKEHANETEDKTGVTFLKDDDINEYLNEVFSEIRTSKDKNDSANDDQLKKV